MERSTGRKAVQDDIAGARSTGGPGTARALGPARLEGEAGRTRLVTEVR